MMKPSNFENDDDDDDDYDDYAENESIMDDEVGDVDNETTMMTNHNMMDDG